VLNTDAPFQTMVVNLAARCCAAQRDRSADAELVALIDTVVLLAVNSNEAGVATPSTTV
jgi:hypothetical protein